MPRLQCIAGGQRVTCRLRSSVAGLVAASLAALVPAVPASGAVPTWTVAPSASQSNAVAGLLANASCPTTTSCFAVGNLGATPYVEHWDGKQWSTMATAPLAGGGSFADVACTSPTACLAIGETYNSGYGALIERWDGTSWSIVPSSGPQQPRGIACASPTDCFAVGSRYNGSPPIEQWDGTTWTPVTTPVVDPDGEDLSSVACASATSCYAVGTSYNHGNRSTLIEHWDGSEWSAVASPDAPGDYPSLVSVSCASDAMCFAIGTYRHAEHVGAPTTRGLTERWDGKRWSVVPSPNASDAYNNIPTDVSCPGPTTCFATRNINPESGPPSRATVDRWNGTAWTVSTTLSLDSEGNTLTGVACASATTCVAVGWIGEPERDAAVQSFIERWNGAGWVTDPVGTHPAAAPSALTAASCVQGGMCFAVGWQPGGEGQSGPLIERRFGDDWRTVTSPARGAATLTGVSCLRSSTCFAVGSYAPNARDTRTLVERWNGRSWALADSPNPDTAAGARANRLLSVSCPTLVCFAVGAVGSGTARPLIERWDGSKWTVVPGPTVIGSSLLDAVSCSSPTKCFAVGQSSKGKSLTERWDGKAWAILAAPAASGADDLTGVSCVSATVCVAVGASTSHGVRHALVLHWNGESWSRQSVANGAGSALRAVSCTGPTRCVAVGSIATAAGSAPLVATTNDGTSWQVGSGAANAAIRTATLAGVTCVDSICVAVGMVDTSVATHTLVQQRT